MRLLPAPTPELSTLRAQELVRFKTRWRHYHRTGYVDLLRRQDGRQRLIDQVRADIAKALWPIEPDYKAPARWRQTDQREPWERVSEEQVKDWIAADPFVREGLRWRVAACLTYLSTFARDTNAPDGPGRRVPPEAEWLGPLQG